jgi:MFS family permease
MAGSAVPGPVKGLAVVSFCNDFASEMVYPLLPAFITGVLGGGAATLGALDGAADLTSAVIRWFSGRLADRPGWRKPLILVGYLTAILVRPVISFASSAWQVVGFRVVDRAGKGLRSPARDAMIAGLTPAAAQGRAFGFHRAADHAGAVAGSVIAWLLLQRQVEVREVIEWSIVPGLAAFLILAWVLRRAGPVMSPTSVPQPSGEGLAPPTRGAVHDATGAAFWVPVAALAALTVFRLPEALLLLRLQDAGVSVALIPLAWAALHVVRSLAAYPGGMLSDRLGAQQALRWGSLFFAVVAASLAFPVPGVVALAIFLGLGLVAGMIEPAERALVAALVPVRAGRGFGTVQALSGIAALPVGIGFGLVYQHLGAGPALVSSALAVAVVALGWREKRDGRRET